MATNQETQARAIQGDKRVKSYQLERRQGVVVAVNNSAQTVDVQLGGDTSTTIPGVATLSNYRAKVGDTCWVDINGPDMLAIDRMGAFGPSVISDAVSAFIDTQESRSSTNYGDLATPGPAATVSISPSGRLLVQVSCWLEANVGKGGGVMGIELSGANSRSTDDREAFLVHGDWTSTDGFVQICASKVTLITGLLPGETTVTAKYKSVSGSSINFELRHLWVLPL